MFADDLKMFMPIRNITDAVNLQSDLDNLYQWCLDNSLFLNIGKCNVLSFTRKNNVFSFHYHVDNQPLTRVDSIKDLGVTFDTKLDFSIHIDAVISKAYRMLGFMKRCTKDFSNVQAIKTLYFSLVRSNLEYCCLIWDPYYNNQTKILERIQNKFTRYLYYKSNHYGSRDLPASFLRNYFSIPSLKSRRDLSCLVFFYKVINNNIDCIGILEYIHFALPTRTRSHTLFPVVFTRYNYIDNFCLYKFYRIFNAISVDVDIFGSSLNVFKAQCSRLLNV